MLKSLMDLFERLSPLAAGEDPRAQEHALQLATAVLLVEVMRSDATLRDVERDAVLAALQEKFALGADEATRLADLAHETARHASDLFTFTSRINEHFDMQQKLRMIELMWSVAYADGKLADHERHVMWRVADLLHIPKGAYAHARIRARDAAGAA
jgi:uncharacterized tellurite resistance protein B-like protein